MFSGAAGDRPVFEKLAYFRTGTGSDFSGWLHVEYKNVTDHPKIWHPMADGRVFGENKEV
ncbi:hypothetical protein DGMP_02350 [Desulfomarina profundi]|uniref:Uncharacterized protein n=1 Tax=Desulfomarina profundi TaxID=2772557 RepID=A0A8D5JKH1_9BACT|nr:hypothetical protein DGMP_02350 [Desulfomarina profundi]